jgi:superfamily II DNA helicase RecQ
VHAIMRQKSLIVAIIGTGAGKSVLFMLLASCLTGVSVVIVPLVLLR